MIQAKGIVIEWIGRNFDMKQVEVNDFPKLPGGTLVKDRETGAKTLVFFDCLNECVMYGTPAEKKQRSYAFR